MDIDGDGESDRETIRLLIAKNGGVVDAEISAAGELMGELTVDTKYLIEGKQPTDKSSERVLESHRRIKAQAQFQSVKSLSIGKFLDYIGYQPDVRTVALGGESTSPSFRPRGTDAPRRYVAPTINFEPIRPQPKPTRY